MTNGFTRVGNADLYSEIAGQGNPMALIHSGVADSRQWNDAFAAFAADFRVLRYDLRGYGKSLPAAGEFSHAADLLALLDRHGLDEPLVLVGSSMGGRMAMDFALAHPSRVKALVMAGSYPSGLQLEVVDHPMEAEAEAAQEAGDLDRVAELEAQIWFDGMGRTARQVDPAGRALALEMNRLALAHAAEPAGKRVPDAKTPAAERLRELAIPVLILVGAHDLPFFQAAADFMGERIPSARKVVVADAAHLLNMEHPAEFQRLVRAFLADPPSARKS